MRGSFQALSGSVLSCRRSSQEASSLAGASVHQASGVEEASHQEGDEVRHHERSDHAAEERSGTRCGEGE